MGRDREDGIAYWRLDSALFEGKAKRNVLNQVQELSGKRLTDVAP